MDAAIVASTYLGHLEHGSAVPIALIPSERTILNAEEIVGRLDGLLLVGGADIDPQFYGASRDPLLEATVPLRDRSELALVTAAMKLEVPVLGICRGLHLMNVATGGTLHQDLGDESVGKHRPAPGFLDERTHHTVEVSEGSELAKVFGPGTLHVNSHHHQAVAEVGAGARVTAVSPGDGLVEAAEWGTSQFAVGVQWHPEAADLGGIIQRFVEVCRGSDVTSVTAQESMVSSQ